MISELQIYFIMFVLFIVTYKFDITDDKVLTFFSFPSIFILYYSLCNFYDYQNYIHYNLFYISYKSYLTVIILLISYVLGFFVPYALKVKSRVGNKENSYYGYSIKKLNLCILITFIISLLALLANLSNVGFNLSALFEDARDYEKSFGDNWLINYMYFLHVPSMILIVFKTTLVNKVRVFDVFLFIMLLFFSLFHGIKFTVFDALFFPLCYYIALKGFSRTAKFYFLSIILIFVAFFASFSFFVRGGGGDFNLLAILDYLVPNYVNLFYSIEKSELLFAYPFDLYIGGLTSFINLPRELPQVLFLVNDKYNMITGFVYIVAGYFYVFSFLFFTSMIYLYIYFSKKRTLSSVFICGYILFSILMMCYAYYFGTKYKYIYFVLVLYVIDVFCRTRRVN
ncbi:oligosaccharide repeat unit polymerase [Vibrio parahaemolyticus]|nr:oligosaccharide repeat unit polymerase [Vibrio parahaemolyticus]EJC6849063.1 oligosaccharide repeat unit polymerase [Vibrio parahaemolyticus]EJC7136383.1 oligosaccharide repeat unit polymerase [Vibrio parahaemolyticus]EKG9569038.1 oligosaccharide repeat unit polymerase [Vibrio parahaemolyticus]EKG9571786.1 oligosaccharide repeat unit polymerase [Vibrio parahaemolyticus]